MLSPFVHWLWTVRWDLAPGEQHVQETLPFPCAHLVFGEAGWVLHGPSTRRFSITLTGSSWVLGVRFRPAGLSAFTREPLRRMVDEDLSLTAIFGASPPPVASPDEAREVICAFLADRAPRPHPDLVRANRLVDHALANPSVKSAAALARVAGCSVRSLHRLLEQRVGLSTRWIVRRARVQAAAERVARGEAVDWSGLARELGYADQAHLTRDFREQVGEPPEAYARRVRAMNL